jgi:hypothetical protein
MADSAASIEKQRSMPRYGWETKDRIIKTEELNEMVDAKTGFVVDALLEGKALQDDGTVARARERLEDSLKRLGARRIKHGWIIPRDDLRKVISFD